MTPSMLPVRLAKRVAELVPCSRSQAERFIEGGWVRVDGAVVDTAQFKILDQHIEIDPQARPEPVLPVTLLVHKPAGYSVDGTGQSVFALLQPANHAPNDRSGKRILSRHLAAQVCVTPLAVAASGLVVMSQEKSTQRKLLEEAALLEYESVVEVVGTVPAEALQQLNRTPVVDGRAMLPVKVSVNSCNERVTALRFAVKGSHPGQIAQMCEAAGLRITALKRIRVGRIPLASLPAGQWRYLMPYERF